MEPMQKPGAIGFHNIEGQLLFNRIFRKFRKVSDVCYVSFTFNDCIQNIAVVINCTTALSVKQAAIFLPSAFFIVVNILFITVFTESSAVCAVALFP